jgi:glucose/arabinose dehydrogenase
MEGSVRKWIPAVLIAAVMAGGVGVAQQGPAGIAPRRLTDASYTFEAGEGQKIRVVVVARGLAHPFSLALLPNGDALVALRGGQLRVVHNAGGASPTMDPAPVGGIPQIVPPYRLGGLHDVVLHPKFAENRLVYFTHNKRGELIPSPDGKQPPRQLSAVALSRGRFDGKALTDVQELFAGEFGGGTGSRLAFGRDGMVYITTGAVTGEISQQLDSVLGKVLRVQDDGRVPKDNPFVGKAGVRPEIYSYGHRDQLGITVHPQSGQVMTAEHGPNGGDEINVIRPGRNYGWPRYSFGRNYDGSVLSERPLVDGIEAPLVVWLPSIAPTGLTFYTGDRFPVWKGNLFVGSARRGELPGTGGLERVVFNEQMGELRRETLLGELHHRIRDVRQGADGLLYVVTDEDDGALLRIEPAS